MRRPRLTEDYSHLGSGVLKAPSAQFAQACSTASANYHGTRCDVPRTSLVYKVAAPHVLVPCRYRLLSPCSLLSRMHVAKCVFIWTSTSLNQSCKPDLPPTPVMPTIPVNYDGRFDGPRDHMPGSHAAVFRLPIVVHNSMRHLARTSQSSQPSQTSVKGDRAQAGLRADALRENS